MVNKTGVNRNTKRQPHWNGKNPAQIPDAAPRSRVALDPVAYDNLIKQHGVRVKVYRSMYCPNVKSVDGGEHNIDCTLCNGSGYLDVDPIESVAYLANQNFQEEMTVEGYHDGNSVGGTFLGGVELQYFTRVDLLDFTQPFYERVLRRPSTPGTGVGELKVTFPDPIPGDFNCLQVFVNAFPSGGFFNILQNGTVIPTNLVIGDFSTGSPIDEIEHFNEEILFVPTQTTKTVDWIDSMVTLINNLKINFPNGFKIQKLRGSVTDGATIQSTCTARREGNSIILTQDVAVSTSGISLGTALQLADTSVISTTEQSSPDNLKYDCKRVNVAIDKTGVQYHQDIDFRLTPQGNVQWGLSTHQPVGGTIYTVHYESVIQYRAISAMHINRFAQVPDRSTGLVAQVKMPEQWMLQKEFLIIRRDEYGKEIKKTGIFGDIIANQPLNPAPADTL